MKKEELIRQNQTEKVCCSSEKEGIVWNTYGNYKYMIILSFLLLNMINNSIQIMLFYSNQTIFYCFKKWSNQCKFLLYY